MGRASKKGNTNRKQSGSTGELIWVDPARCRFQHSKIRQHFSGCGRSVNETLACIERNELSPLALPPIQVLIGPEDEDGPWYFSLNNRRLWVLKRCREQGLIENNQIRVRVRVPKSDAERRRYTIENCALEATFVREMKAPETQHRMRKEAFVAAENSDLKRTDECRTGKEPTTEGVEESDSEDSDNDSNGSYGNRFSALL